MNSAEGGEEDLSFCKVGGMFVCFKMCLASRILFRFVCEFLSGCLFVCLLANFDLLSKLVSCNYRNFLLKVYFFEILL